MDVYCLLRLLPGKVFTNVTHVPKAFIKRQKNYNLFCFRIDGSIRSIRPFSSLCEICIHFISTYIKINKCKYKRPKHNRKCSKKMERHLTNIYLKSGNYMRKWFITSKSQMRGLRLKTVSSQIAHIEYDQMPKRKCFKKVSSTTISQLTSI